MRLLVFTQHYPPDNSGAAFRIQDTARALRALGHELTVVAPAPAFPWGAHRRRWRRKEMDIDEGVQVVRLWAWQPRGPDPGFVPRMAYYLLFALHASLWALWNGGRHDAVVAGTPPLFTVFPAWVARLGRKRLLSVVDVQDLWIDAAVSLGFVREGNPLTKLSRAVELRSWQKADVVAVTTSHMRDMLAARAVDAGKMVVIPNGVDTTRFPARGREPSTTFVYAGNIGHAQDLETVVQAMAIVHAQVPAARLVLAGDGDRRQALMDLADQEGLRDSIQFLGVVPRAEVAHLIRTALAGVAFLKKLPELEYAVPTKAYEYLAGGIPFLGASGAEVEALARESGGGLAVGNSVQAVADAMLWFLGHPDEALAMGERGREHVTRFYGRAAVAQRLVDAVSAAAAQRGAMP